MHIVENKSKSGKKIYRSILLRESYQEGGKVKKRTIANLSNYTSQEIEAIKLELSHKEDLSKLGFSREAGAVAGNGMGDRSGNKAVGGKAGAGTCSGRCIGYESWI